MTPRFPASVKLARRPIERMWAMRSALVRSWPWRVVDRLDHEVSHDFRSLHVLNQRERPVSMVFNQLTPVE
jgi:hypothetical protein